jgi:hypothetical protein
MNVLAAFLFRVAPGMTDGLAARPQDEKYGDARAGSGSRRVLSPALASGHPVQSGRPSTCFGPTSAHDARDAHPRHLFDANGWFVRAAVLCSGCMERLRSMGMDWREERRAVPERTAWQRMRRVA